MSNITPLQTIKITQTAKINGTEQEVFDARTLHEQLKSQKHFADWIKKRLEDFVENIDFISFSPKSEKPLGGRPSKEYLLTIDTAKHLAMMENTQIGKEVRLAFIEAEKELRRKQAPQLTPQETIYQLAEGLLKEKNLRIEAEEKSIALENTVKEKETIIEKQKALFKQMTDGTGCIKFRQCADFLNIPESKLRDLLVNKFKWRRKASHTTTTEGREGGFVKMMTTQYKRKFADGTHKIETTQSFVITEKGFLEIQGVLCEKKFINTI